MVSKSSSPIAQDSLSNAIKTFSELAIKFPDKSRKEILQEIELKFDLSPLECEFLDKHFSSES